MASSRPRSRHRCLAVCTPGLEELLERELEQLGIRTGQQMRGGVAFQGSTRQLYAANLWLRTATRVLLRVAQFRATSFAALEQEARFIEWDRWLADGTTPAFRVTATKSKLHHTGAIAERLAAAAATPSTLSKGEVGQELVVRADHDTFTISINSSGRPLYHRGWRGPQGKAPLRETLAAAVLLAVGWDGSSPLIDPMCGSGTIAIEAAMLARRMAPGWQRTFAFADWPAFEPGTWASVAGEATSLAKPGVDVPIMASDRDDGAVRAAAANASRAGVAGDINIERRAISEISAPAARAGSQSVDGGWLISNPPYGRRASSGQDLRNLFARLGQVTTAELPGWHVALLVNDPRAVGHSEIELDERLRTTNGGIDVRLLTGRA